MNDVAVTIDLGNHEAAARRWSPWRWLIVAGIVGLVLAVAIPMKVAYDCQHILNSVRAAGGEVLIQTAPYDTLFGDWLFKTRRRVHPYLAPGISCLDRSQKLNIILDESASINDDWLQKRNFSALPCRVMVQISHPDVTDVGIRSLSRIAHLELLAVPRTSLTDIGLDAFIGHPDLTDLYLSETRVTNASLPVLTSLPELISLNVAFTDISGDELHRLRACRQLQVLAVDASQLTEPFLSAISRFPKLTRLYVQSSTIGPLAQSQDRSIDREPPSVVNDGLLQRLLRETTIISLWIEDGSAITDASVPALLKAGHLQWLDIAKVGISTDEVLKVNSIHRSRIGNQQPALRVPSQTIID